MFGSNILKDIFTYLSNFFGFNNPFDIIKSLIDISIVSYIVYKVIVLVRETRAMQLVKGLLIILVSAKLSEILGLRTIAYLLSNSIQLLGFALVVLFQPELRRGLEQIGRSRFSRIIKIEDDSADIKTMTAIEEIVNCCSALAENFVGALIVVERDTKIGDIIKTGTQLDSIISKELLGNIFTPNTPLHDGAVIIRDNKIKAASCYLPLTENPNLSKQLGTRHRAALGITEVSDAVAIVVSEESGKISFALNGSLTRNLTPDLLRKALNKNLINKEKEKKKILQIWKAKEKNE